MTTPDAPPTGAARRAEPWVLLAAIVGSGMAFADTTVVNVALSVLQSQLGATVVEAQWVVESYMLLLASFLLIGGAAGDRYGRRRVFTFGVGVFAAASLWCGLAGSVGELIAARAAQGLGAALLVPGSLALIASTVPAERRGRAIGVWSAFSAVSAGVGLLLGGVMLDYVSWRAAFLVNLPLAAGVMLVCRYRVPETRSPAAGPLDWPGAALATAALAGVTFGLIEASNYGWGDRRVVGSLAAGGVMGVIFVLREATARTPMVPLGLFRSRCFSGANVLTLLLYGALGGGLFFLPLNLIQVQGYSKVAAGAANLPFIAVMVLLSGRAGKWADRFGTRPLLVIGPCAAASAYVAFAVTGVGGSYWVTFFPATLLLGVGMALTVTPLTVAVMGAVAESQVGTASGVNNAASRVASVLAIAVFGPVMVAAFGDSLAERLSDADVRESVRADVMGMVTDVGGLTPPESASEGEAAAVAGAVKRSFVVGFRTVMLSAAGLAVLAAAAGWLTVENVPRRKAGGLRGSPGVATSEPPARECDDDCPTHRRDGADRLRPDLGRPGGRPVQTPGDQPAQG